VIAFTSLRKSRAQVQAWTRGTGSAALVSRATGREGITADRDAVDPSISDDGRRIAFSSAATNLSPAKTDNSRAIFVRDLSRANTRLSSDPTAAYPRAALAKVVAALKARPPAPAALGAESRPPLQVDEVAITDNAFFAGTDRPTVHIQAGERVTWLWESRQSHAVTVRTGPQRFATRTRHGGRFEYRFQRAGTYDLVCSLHAPGMRMTIVVK
jgi:plastocyanin